MLWRKAARVPILTWHGIDVSGPDHATNDHVAFREDLELLHRLGLRVVPLAAIARAHARGKLDALAGCVGLSFDDGADFDYHDLPHPAWGPQRSMSNILADFRARHGGSAQPSLHATAFTVVSPWARRTLDATCMIGCGWWNDDWYARAEHGGTISVESHSWDHNHATLPATVTSAPRESFQIADDSEAEAEIGEAARVLRELRGRGGDVLFAYPFGDVSEFLATEWLPRRAAALGIPAAFSANDESPVHAGSSRWALPRFTARHNWKSPEELERLLRETGAVRKPSARDVAAAAPATPVIEKAQDWRDHLRTWEVHDAKAVAGDLFKRSFGHEIPDYRRHFVLVYSPPPGAEDSEPRIVAYVHQSQEEEFYLCGGMCVDERAYRRFPKWLFEQVRREGGLATIVTRDSMRHLGASPASFGHVGEPRARAADLRTGFVDTGIEHLMVMWLKPLSGAEKERLVARAAALAPF